MAAAKIETETNELERARVLLTRAVNRVGTERVWLKSAILARDMNNMKEEKRILDEALNKFPQVFSEFQILYEFEFSSFPDFIQYPKFWMMRGQMEKDPIPFYQKGLQNTPHSIPLWLCLSNSQENPSKSRSILEKARIMNPKNDQLWLAAVRNELGSGNHIMANSLLAKALQECQNSGILWAEAIEMEKPQFRKTKSIEALKRCEQDPVVMVQVAKLFWSERKLEKARTWFNRAGRIFRRIVRFLTNRKTYCKLI